MAHVKDRHYWAQLRATITAGSWDASFPAKAPNGTPLSWSELLRKFNKHCVGFADVAELVSQTQALSLLLAANAKDQTLDSDEGRLPNDLTLGDEGVLLEERMEEGSSGYNVLQGLQCSKADVRRRVCSCQHFDAHAARAARTASQRVLRVCLRTSG